MDKVLQRVHALSPDAVVFVGVLLVVCSLSSRVIAKEQPTATITKLTGSARVSLQGKEEIEATLGMVLHEGDSIQTLPELEGDMAAELTLSEGSLIKLDKNTKLDIALLFQDPKTGARKSRLKLFYGWIRAVLSPGHQKEKEESFFEVETPEAQVGVQFSQPVVDVSYNPEKAETRALSYTVSLIVSRKETVEAQLGMVLHEGDSIQTLAEGEGEWAVELTLSDGSQIRLAKNTRLDMAALQYPSGVMPERQPTATITKLIGSAIVIHNKAGETRAIMEGKMAIVSIKEGILIETPNAKIGVKF